MNSNCRSRVGFRKDWKLGCDSEKWHEVGEHLMIPGWKLEITNLQFLAAQSPYVLFPTDSLAFPPITNFSIPEFNPTNEIGHFRLLIRSTDFINELSANVLFIRVSSNSFKPFVTTLHLGTNGIWRISMSPKEIEDSQQ